MVVTHKHKGVVRSDTGALRMHPITQQHKEPLTKRAHNYSLAFNQEKFKQGGVANKKVLAKKKKVTKKKVANLKQIPKVQGMEKKYVQAVVDGDGFISIDLDKSNTAGIRLKFTRIQGRRKRIVALEIKNER